MSGSRVLGFSGVVALLIFLITGVPASVVPSLTAGAGLTVTSTSGSVWSGQARGVRLRGVSLGRANWQLKPLSLLLGRIAVEFDLAGGQGFAHGRIARSILGQLTVDDLQATYPLSAFQSLVGFEGASGQLSIDAPRIVVTNDWPSDLDARIRLNQLSFAVGTTTPQLVGNFALEFSATEIPPDGSISGAIQDEGGPLELAGTLSLNPPNLYLVRADIRARPSASRGVSDSLILLGAPAQNGFRELRLEGSL
jgi:hypothetical protein